MPTIISEWIYCPVCGNKTRTMIREDTELKNFPLYCPKCKQETIINVASIHLPSVPLRLNSCRLSLARLLQNSLSAVR